MVTGRNSAGIKRRSKRGIWFYVLLVGLGLTVSFAIVNLFNEQSIYSSTQLLSMLLTTFPLMIGVVVGVYFVFGGNKRRARR